MGLVISFKDPMSLAPGVALPEVCEEFLLPNRSGKCYTILECNPEEDILCWIELYYGLMLIAISSVVACFCTGEAGVLVAKTAFALFESYNDLIVTYALVIDDLAEDATFTFIILQMCKMFVRNSLVVTEAMLDIPISIVVILNSTRQLIVVYTIIMLVFDGLVVMAAIVITLCVADEDKPEPPDFGSGCIPRVVGGLLQMAVLFVRPDKMLPCRLCSDSGGCNCDMEALSALNSAKLYIAGIRGLLALILTPMLLEDVFVVSGSPVGITALWFIFVFTTGTAGNAFIMLNTILAILVALSYKIGPIQTPLAVIIYLEFAAGIIMAFTLNAIIALAVLATILILCFSMCYECLGGDMDELCPDPETKQ